MNNKSWYQLNFPSYIEWHDSTRLQKLDNCMPNMSFSVFPIATNYALTGIKQAGLTI